MNDYVNMFKRFLPQTAVVLTLQKPLPKEAILLADMDGDQVEELIGAFRYQEKNYILILKKVNNEWQPLLLINGSGYGISDLLAVPIADSKRNTLIVGWQVGTVWSEFNLFQWTDNKLVPLLAENVVYSKLEVEDMPSNQGQDGKYELAVWTHDTGEAYKVEVYRFNGSGLVPAKDVYPYYFKKVAAYYQELLKTNDFSFYWYYLSDAQEKTGDLEQALLSIDRALSHSSPYPSEEVLLEKRKQIVNQLGHNNPNSQVVVDQKRGDVTGDGSFDIVSLAADKTEGSPFWQNITLVIRDGKTNMYERIALKENAGYHPTLFLGDFTGNHIDDILIVIDTGGSGGTIYAYVYSFLDGEMRQVFDADEYNERSKYAVNYQDQFKVNVTSFDSKKEYTLDLMYKGKEYLSEIYDENGTLKAPIEGWVDPIGGLYPIDFERDGTYELMAIQEIAGRYHADALGYVNNMLKWNGHEFISDRQNVSIFGADINLI